VENQGLDTLAVRSGTFSTPTNAASSPPLYQASSYEFGDLDEVAGIYGGEVAGRIYGRLGGPNGAHFESAIAELEGAQAAVGAASGMAAIDAALKTNLAAGEAILATSELYGGTYSLLEKDYQERGVRVAYVDQCDLAAVRAALERERPRVLYLEALTNPLTHVADLPALADLAREFGALTIVDATFASPVLVRPLAHGIDLVVHSCGKYLGGHGDVGAGVLSGRADLIERARSSLVRTGATIPHFEAWLALRGVRTLALRMARHSTNAVAVAATLAASAEVAAVHHPSRPEHPQHALAGRLYPRGTGGIVAFDLRGGAVAVDLFLRELRGIPIVHSLGEVATTIAYPAVSSHRPLPPEVRRGIGVGDGTLRFSVGIEDPADLTAEIERALAGLSARVRA
jgi:cystathionine beta-lyase/cystathionine gamma-synthase